MPIYWVRVIRALSYSYITFYFWSKMMKRGNLVTKSQAQLRRWTSTRICEESQWGKNKSEITGSIMIRTSFSKIKWEWAFISAHSSMPRWLGQTYDIIRCQLLSVNIATLWYQSTHCQWATGLKSRTDKKGYEGNSNKSKERSAQEETSGSW